MNLNLLLALLFTLMIAIFAAQNAQPVEIRFLSWGWVTSLVVVIVGSATLGALLASTLSLVRQVSMKVQARERQNRLRQVEQELERFQRRAQEQEQEILRLQGELADARRAAAEPAVGEAPAPATPAAATAAAPPGDEGPGVTRRETGPAPGGGPSPDEDGKPDPDTQSGSSGPA